MRRQIGQTRVRNKIVKLPKFCSFEILYFSKIIVLEAPDEVLMKRLEDGDNFNDALETIPKRIKTYRSVILSCVADFAALFFHISQ